MRVRVGQTLSLYLRKGASSGNTYSYGSFFLGLGTSFFVNNSPKLVRVAEGVRAYNVKKHTDYPLPTTVFSRISLRVVGGVPWVVWTAVNQWRGGPTVVVTRQGGTNAIITVRY